VTNRVTIAAHTHAHQRTLADTEAQVRYDVAQYTDLRTWLRRGTYRIVYRIDESSRVVHVLDIDHRSEIYHRPQR
jgi:mRNA-degrading endonuclease RelE of RelBE toxin-antitoxin system